MDKDSSLVNEVMSSPVLTAMPDTFVTEDLALMQTRNIRKIASNEGKRVNRDSYGNRHPLLVFQSFKRIKFTFINKS